MNDNFVWPSDQDRADDDELNRVCTELEDVMDEAEADRKMAHIYRVESINLRNERNALASHYEALVHIVTNHCCVDMAGTGLMNLFSEVSDHLRTKPIAALQSQKDAYVDADVWMYQHEETGQVGFIDQWQVEHNFEENNPRLQLICKLYRKKEKTND